MARLRWLFWSNVAALHRMVPGAWTDQRHILQGRIVWRAETALREFTIGKR